MKRYEDKVFTNLTSAEAELKQTFEQVPRFGGIGDASDHYYLSSQVQAEKMAALASKSLEDQEISNFKMKSFVKSVAKPAAEPAPHIASKPAREPPVASAKIVIKTKKRKADDAEATSDLKKESNSSNKITTSEDQNKSVGIDVSVSKTAATSSSTAPASATTAQKVSQPSAPPALPIYYSDSSDEES